MSSAWEALFGEDGEAAVENGGHEWDVDATAATVHIPSAHLAINRKPPVVPVVVAEAKTNETVSVPLTHARAFMPSQQLLQRPLPPHGSPRRRPPPPPPNVAKAVRPVDHVLPSRTVVDGTGTNVVGVAAADSMSHESTSAVNRSEAEEGEARTKSAVQVPNVYDMVDVEHVAPRKPMYMERESRQLSADQLFDLEDLVNEDGEDVETEKVRLIARQQQRNSTPAPAIFNATDAVAADVMQTPPPGPPSMYLKPLLSTVPARHATGNSMDQLLFSPGRKASYATTAVAETVTMLSDDKTQLDLSGVLGECHDGNQDPGNVLARFMPIHDLSRLIELNLSSNGLDALPEELGGLVQLCTLNISFNRCTSLSSSVLSRLVQLEKLTCTGNALVALPDIWTPGCKHVLRELDVSDNFLTELDLRSLEGLLHLELLAAGGNMITHIRTSTTNLLQLKHLDLSGNHIEQALDVGCLPGLRVLRLNDSHLHVLPSGANQLVLLEEFDISGNHIKRIPATYFQKMVRLRELFLQQNEISVLSSALMLPDSLEVFDLRRNPLAVIPVSLGALPNLVTLLVDAEQEAASEVLVPPPDVRQQGTAAMIAFLRDIKKGGADAKSSFAYGSGLAKRVIASSTESFVIRAVDIYGVAKRAGGDRFKVKMRVGSDITDIETVDAGDGMYYVEYDARQSGDRIFLLLLDDQQLKGSPHFVNVEPAAVDPASCELTTDVEQPLTVVAGVDHVLDVVLRDEYGNDATATDVQVEATISGKSETFNCQMLPAKANNVNPSLIFSQKTVGDFDITVLVNGEPIANSPIHVRIVTAPVDPSRTALIAPSSVEAGLPCTLTICAKDHFGNPCTSGDDLFEVTLADATGWRLPVERPVHRGGGEYTATITMRTAGNYAIGVMYFSTDGGTRHHVTESPISINVTPVARSQVEALQQQNERLSEELTAVNSKNVTLRELLDRERAAIATMSMSRVEAKQEPLALGPDDEQSFLEYILRRAGPTHTFHVPIFGEIICRCARSRPGASSESFLERTRVVIQEAMQQREADYTKLAFWLANIIHICCFLRQEPRHYDSHQRFTELLQQTYQRMYKSVQSKLSPVIVNGFIDGTHPIAEDRRAAVPTTSPPCAKRRSNIDNVVQIFDGVHETLLRHCVPAVVIEQLVRQALYFVDALLVNALLLRRALCDEATTRKMKSNLIVLERWAVSRGLQNTLKEVDPVLAAIELLHVPFTTLEADADLRKIKSLCRPLTAPQVEKLIRSSEQNVSPVMIDRIIHLVLQGTSRSKNASVSSVRSVSSRDAVTSNDDSQIFIDTFATEPLRIPPTVVSTSVVLPASLNLPYVNTPTVSECQSEV